MPSLKTPSFLSKLTDPDQGDKSARKPRGFASLIRKDSRNKVAPTTYDRDVTPSKSQPDTTPGSLCKNKIGDESCWTVTVPSRWQESVRRRVDDLIDTQNHNLYKHDRREFDSYKEIFLVGKTLAEARLAMVISCNSDADLERLKKLLKKHHHVPNYDNVRLLAMSGGPRSTVSLIPLSAPETPSTELPDPHETLLQGTTVYAVLGPSNTLTIPVEIGIGRSLEESHKAVIGGLLSVGPEGHKVGLTVGHVSPINLNPATRESGSMSAVGTISQIAPDPNVASRPEYLDWALIKFDEGIKLRTSVEPPGIVSSEYSEPVIVKLLAPRGPIRGILSPGYTDISLKGRQNSTRTHAIVLDEPIRAGDCGIWVVDSDGTMYGHIAFGHAGDNVAYVVPVQATIDDIKTEIEAYRNKVSLATLGEGAQREILDRDDQRKADRARTRARASGSKTAPVQKDYDSDRSEVRRITRSGRHGLSLHKRWRAKFRKDDRKENIRFAGTCMAYMFFLSGIMIAYLALSTWAISSGSKIAARGRTRQATLMYETIEELRQQVYKQMAKHHPDVLDAVPTGDVKSSKKRLEGFERRAQQKSGGGKVSNSTPITSTAEASPESKSDMQSSTAANNTSVPPKQNNFWSRLWRKVSGSKATPSPSDITSTENGLRSEKLVTPPPPVYKYSGDEDSDDDDTDDDFLKSTSERIIDLLGKRALKKQQQRNSSISRRRDISRSGDRAVSRSRDRRYSWEDEIVVRHEADRERDREYYGSDQRREVRTTTRYDDGYANDDRYRDDNRYREDDRAARDPYSPVQSARAGNEDGYYDPVRPGRNRGRDPSTGRVEPIDDSADEKHDRSAPTTSALALDVDTNEPSEGGSQIILRPDRSER